MENYASLWRRIWGGLIDIIIVLFFFYVYVRFFGTLLPTGEYHVSGFPALVLFLTILLYYVILEALTGKTVGKLLVKTRVVKLNGEKISWGQAIVRNLCRIIDGFCFYLVAVIVIAFTKRNQRVGDLIAKTVVIKEHY